MAKTFFISFVDNMRISVKENTYNLNFNAMKPNQFLGADYAVVRKFKAPVEKFNTHNDFYAWVKEKLDTILSTAYKSRAFYAEIYRNQILNAWKNYFEQNDKKYSFPEQLLVFSSLVKDLKSTDDNLPPELRPSALNASFDLIKNLLNKNKDELFDFKNVYYNQLKTELILPLEKSDGWIVIPSGKNDNKNFDDNVLRLQLLSSPKWCTKSYYAKSYLLSGDFHIYLEKGLPKLGIRFSGSQIIEIQGVENNDTIPQEYLKKVKDYIKSGDYFTCEDVDYILEKSEENKI